MIVLDKITQPRAPLETTTHTQTQKAHIPDISLYTKKHPLIIDQSPKVPSSAHIRGRIVPWGAARPRSVRIGVWSWRPPSPTRD